MELSGKLELLGAKNIARHVNSKKYETFTGQGKELIKSFSGIEQELIEKAITIRKNSKSPYFNFSVGACTLGDDDKFYWGTNKEEETCDGIHAEYSAIVTMTTNHKIDTILAIAIAMRNDSEDSYPMPCGGCRQKIRGVSQGNTPIIGVSINDYNEVWRIDITSIECLLPYAFGGRNLTVR